MNVIGLDASLTAAGIAILGRPEYAESPNVPTLLTVGDDGKNKDPLIARSKRISKQFSKIIRSLPPRASEIELVVIEELPFTQPKFSGLYQERCALFYRLVEFLDSKGISVVEVNVNTLKLWATGNGHAKKPQVISAMKELWPHARIRNDNESDALALASMGAQFLGWHDPELPHHYAPKVDWTGVSK